MKTLFAISQDLRKKNIVPTSEGFAYLYRPFQLSNTIMKRVEKAEKKVFSKLISQSCSTTVYPEAGQVLCFIYLKLVTLIGGWKL